MKSIFATFLFFAGAAFAQQWELGGSAGASFLPMVSVNNPAGSASAGFGPGVAAGVYVGQSLNPRISGEIHYTFLQSNLKLSNSGTDATFSGNSHAIYYDVLIHSQRRESRAQWFAAVGGGMKLYRGTGKEEAFQPLSQFAYFTKTNKAEPMLSVGGGVKFRVAPHVTMRAEVRDYLTPFPKELITPAPGSKIGSWLNDIVPLVTVTYEK
jgi:outer membrane protein with beta-barrel domain